MELTDKNVRMFYEYAAYLISLAVLYGYVPFVAVISSRKTSLSNVGWILGIAASDLCVAINLSITGWLLIGKNEHRSEFGCQAYAIMALGLGFANLACITFNAMDRHHRKFKPGTTPPTSPLLITGVWIASFVLGGLPLLGIGRYDSMGENTVFCLLDVNAKSNESFTLTLAALLFFLPMLVVYAAYAKLARTSDDYKPMESVVKAVMISYVPYIFYVLATPYGLEFPDWAVALCHLFPKTLSVMNPRIYLQDPEIKKIIHSKEQRVAEKGGINEKSD